MKRSTSSTTASKTGSVFSVAKRHSMAAHEQLLLATQEYLPTLLMDELQNANPLNENIRSQSEEWRQRIEDLIAAKGLKGAEAKIWRSVPDIRFTNPALNSPSTVLGKTLTKRVDSPRTGRSSTPILVADFALRVAIPSWTGCYLRDGRDSSYPKEPIATPSDALSIQQWVLDVPLFGQVFPAGCPLGEVAIEMARLVDAVQHHVVDTREAGFTHRDDSALVLMVTDSETIFDAFAEQYDAVYFPNESDKVIWRFDKLETFHARGSY